MRIYYAVIAVFGVILVIWIAGHYHLGFLVSAGAAFPMGTLLNAAWNWKKK